MELSDSRRPVWLVLETETSGRTAEDAAHWVSVYTNLVTLLAKGAAVSIGDRHGNELVGLGLDEVRERLTFWQLRLSSDVAS